MNARSGASPWSKASCWLIVPFRYGWTASLVDLLDRRRHDERGQEEREADEDLVGRQLRDADRVPHQREHDDDARERGHHHQDRRRQREHRHEHQDLDSGRDVLGVVGVDERLAALRDGLTVSRGLGGAARQCN